MVRMLGERLRLAEVRLVELTHIVGARNGKAFVVSMPGEGSRTFDGFERAIHALALACENCGIGVIGHGVGAGGRFSCRANCASQAGAGGGADRA